jgi:hypothetical protein
MVSQIRTHYVVEGIMGKVEVTPVVITETINALKELLDSGYGRANPKFDMERERKARLTAIDLLERWYLTGGQ